MAVYQQSLYKHKAVKGTQRCAFNGALNYPHVLGQIYHPVIGFIYFETIVLPNSFRNLISILNIWYIVDTYFISLFHRTWWYPASHTNNTFIMFTVLVVVYISYFSRIVTVTFSACDIIITVSVDVNIGWGNGLVPSGNKPLPEPMLSQQFPFPMRWM